MPNARPAESSDLAALLALFRASDVSAAAGGDVAESIWAQILSRDDLAVFVSAADDAIVAICMLITAPNLLRAERRHGFLENVVTHPEHQGRGHGRAVVAAALAEAWVRDCHHVLLQSGRRDARVHRFYEACGFEPGMRTGYMVRRLGTAPALVRPLPGIPHISRLSGRQIKRLSNSLIATSRMFVRLG